MISFDMKKVSTIEYFYREDGMLEKENHLRYEENSIKATTIEYKELTKNVFIGYINGEQHSVTTYNDHGDIVMKYIGGKIPLSASFKYGKHGLSKLIKNDKEIEYFYDKDGIIVFMRFNKDEDTDIEVEIVGNQLIYIDPNGNTYKTETYDEYGNLVYENHGTYCIKKEYNMKGQLIKSEMYSNVLK